MSLREFGNLIGMSHAQVANFESGDQNMSLETLIRLLQDDRPQIFTMAFRIFHARLGQLISTATSTAERIERLAKN